MEDVAARVASKPEVLLLDKAQTARPAVLAGLKEAHGQLMQGVGRRRRRKIPPLCLDGFDGEQIWEQLELVNTMSLPLLGQAVAKLSAMPVDEGISLIAQLGTQLDEEEDEEEEKGGEGDGAPLDWGSDGEQEQRAHGGDEEDEEEAEEGEGEGGKNWPQRQGKRKRTAAAVEDDFFQLADMEAFLKDEDAREARKRAKAAARGDQEKEEEEDEDDDEDGKNDNLDALDLDLFADFGDDGEDGEEEEGSGGKGLSYGDLFDPPTAANGKAKPRKTDDLDEEEEEEEEEDEGDEEEEDEEMKGDDKSDGEEEEDEDEDEEEEEGQTRHERAQARMKKKISALEEFNVSDKPWQLAGEVDSKGRPLNSLLEEDLDFEHLTRTAPEVTEEVTLGIEDLIKKRIRDGAWDDVERKAEDLEEEYRPRRTIELNDEKSKDGLGEVYAKEFAKAAAGQTNEAEEQLKQRHKEIDDLFAALDAKLNALTNFNYAPLKPREDMAVVANVATVQMEDVTPITMSTATKLAPEEISEKAKGDVKAQSEKTTTDRKRERRTKKRKKGLERRRKEKALNLAANKPGLGKFTKKMAMETITKTGRDMGTSVTTAAPAATATKLGSSTAFFKQLQAQTQMAVGQAAAEAKAGGKKKRRKQNRGAELRL